MIEPPTTSGIINREVRQALMDVEEFVGAPRTGKREPDRYQTLVAEVAALAFRRPYNIKFGWMPW